jgi:hypothetical protein
MLFDVLIIYFLGFFSCVFWLLLASIAALAQARLQVILTGFVSFKHV